VVYAGGTRDTGAAVRFRSGAATIIPQDVLEGQRVFSSKTRRVVSYTVRSNPPDEYTENADETW
jgi:hypothetical protein